MFGGGFNPFGGGGMNPETMKMASEMISKMSDEELKNYAKMMGKSFILNLISRHAQSLSRNASSKRWYDGRQKAQLLGI